MNQNDYQLALAGCSTSRAHLAAYAVFLLLSLACDVTPVTRVHVLITAGYPLVGPAIGTSGTRALKVKLRLKTKTKILDLGMGADSGTSREAV